MVHSHAHPTAVAALLVDPVRKSLAEFLIGKIMNVHRLRGSLRLPLPACILELPHWFLLLGIYCNHGLSPLLKGPRLSSDIFELGIAVRMLRPRLGFAVGLQTVLQILLEHTCHRSLPDAVPFPAQFHSQLAGALGGPA